MRLFWTGILAGALIPAAYAADWPSGYTKRKAITINHTKVSGATNLVDFPVLVSLTDANLRLAAKTDGSDILFTAADGVTRLNYEIEQYSSATGQLTAWVSVPSLSPSANTVLYVYYGNPDATSQQNGTGVWDANYKGVWHLTNSAADSTTLHANGTAVGAPGSAAGKTGNAGLLNGSSQYYNIGTNAAYNVGAQLTVEAWVYYQGIGLNNGIVVMKQNATGATGAAYSLLVQTASGKPTLSVATTSTPWADYAASSALTQNTWNHLVGTYQSGALKLYVNGTQAASSSTPAGNLLSTTGGLYIGHEDSWVNECFKGALDEVRVSNAARSADWIKTEYDNQSAPGGFYSVSGEETPSGTATNTAAMLPRAIIW